MTRAIAALSMLCFGLVVCTGKPSIYDAKLSDGAFWIDEVHIAFDKVHSRRA